MASHEVEVVECDFCGAEEAETWTIMGPDGQWRVIELCRGKHDKHIGNIYLKARPLRPEKKR